MTCWRLHAGAEHSAAADPVPIEKKFRLETFVIREAKPTRHKGVRVRLTPPRVHHLSPARDDFRGQVLRGLRQSRKQLPCKFFYDRTGSQLFDRICDLPEYYLTRTELGILQSHVDEM